MAKPVKYDDEEEISSSGEEEEDQSDGAGSGSGEDEDEEEAPAAAGEAEGEEEVDEEEIEAVTTGAGTEEEEEEEVGRERDEESQSTEDDEAIAGDGDEVVSCRVFLGHYAVYSVNEELTEIDGQISDIFRTLQNGFQKLDKIKDANRRSRQLEELTDIRYKMRDCKRLIKDFERVVKEEAGHTDPETAKMLHDRKQSMIKELNSYVALKKQHASENKRVDLFDGPSVEDGFGEENVLLASKVG